MSSASHPAKRADPAAGYTRRELLNYAWLASLGILALESGILFWRYARPPLRPGDSGGPLELGPLADLPAADGPPLRVASQQFWWSMTDAGALALLQACPHLGCALDWDETLGRFVCPCHGSQFARDGSCLGGPATRGMDRFVVRALNAAGQEVARTDGTAGPVRIPTGSTVIVETGQPLPGPPRRLSGPAAQEGQGNASPSRAG